MTTAHFTTASQGRQHFKELLDAAEAGVPNVVRREHLRAVVVDGDRFRDSLLAAQPARAEMVSEAGGWSIFLPGWPISADGATVDEALKDMVAALREYSEDWVDHLRHAVNHREAWALVQLVDLSTDEQLKEWLSS